MVRVESNLWPKSEFSDAAPDCVDALPVDGFGELGTAVVVEVAGDVLGAAAFVTAGVLGPLSDGSVSRCTNPT